MKLSLLRPCRAVEPPAHAMSCPGDHWPCEGSPACTVAFCSRANPSVEAEGEPPAAAEISWWVPSCISCAVQLGHKVDPACGGGASAPALLCVSCRGVCHRCRRHKRLACGSACPGGGGVMCVVFWCHDCLVECAGADLRHPVTLGPGDPRRCVTCCRVTCAAHVGLSCCLLCAPDGHGNRGFCTVHCRECAGLCRANHASRWPVARGPCGQPETRGACVGLSASDRSGGGCASLRSLMRRLTPLAADLVGLCASYARAVVQIAVWRDQGRPPQLLCVCASCRRGPGFESRCAHVALSSRGPVSHVGPCLRCGTFFRDATVEAARPRMVCEACGRPGHVRCECLGLRQLLALTTTFRRRRTVTRMVVEALGQGTVAASVQELGWTSSTASPGAAPA